MYQICFNKDFKRWIKKNAATKAGTWYFPSEDATFLRDIWYSFSSIKDLGFPAVTCQHFSKSFGILKVAAILMLHALGNASNPAPKIRRLIITKDRYIRDLICPIRKAMCLIMFFNFHLLTCWAGCVCREIMEKRLLIESQGYNRPWQDIFLQYCRPFSHRDAS